jgi:predicted transcriptional regulator
MHTSPHSPLLYLAALNLALRRFPELTPKRLLLVERLCRLNRPIKQIVFYRLLWASGYCVNAKVFGTLVRDSVELGLITRTKFKMNVSYCITLKGRVLIERFNKELEKIANSELILKGIIDQ